MDIQNIKELLNFIIQLDITKVKIKTADIKLYIQKPEKLITSTAHTTTTSTSLSPVTAEQKIIVSEEKNHTSTEEEAYVTIKSPMIGTFYIKPNPESAPFVNIGDQIKKNQVVCIIEAMKIFNDIESHINGKIVKILVKDASPVEFDQPLFLVAPND